MCFPEASEGGAVIHARSRTNPPIQIHRYPISYYVFVNHEKCQYSAFIDCVSAYRVDAQSSDNLKETACSHRPCLLPLLAPSADYLQRNEIRHSIRYKAVCLWERSLAQSPLTIQFSTHNRSEIPIFNARRPETLMHPR